MFGKEGDIVSGGEGNLNSILGPGCKVTGTIELKGTIRVDGEFDGEVNCPETLIIGKSGTVKADVKVKNAVIGGKLLGNIEATNKIELQTGSHVEGDITTARLVIDEGVFFEGACRMGTTTTPTKSASSSKQVSHNSGSHDSGHSKTDTPNTEWSKKDDHKTSAVK